MKRDVSLDILRGVMLVVMTINHLGGPLLKVTFQPFGFVSAAEGFIYLSGLVYGLVYYQILLKKGRKSVVGKTWHRSFIIYITHIAIFLIILSISQTNFYYNQIVSTDLNLVFLKPWQKITQFFILFFQPENLDILPLYILLLIASPIALRCFHSNKRNLFFAISFLVYLGAQWNIFYNFLYKIFPNAQFGYFNIFAWQFLFFIGVFIGFNRVQKSWTIPRNKYVVSVSIIGLVILLLIRHTPPELTILHRLVYHFSHRPTLEFFRLTNFLLLAYILDYLIHKKLFFNSEFLAILGRHSLQVFGYHLLILFLFKPIFNMPYLQERPVLFITFQLLLVLSLYIPAKLHEYLVKTYPAFKKTGL